MSSNAYLCDVIHVRVLGRLELIDRDGRSIEVGGRQARTVFAALAITEGRPVTADALIEMLWGEHAPNSAGGTLQSYVSRLRRVLNGWAGLLFDNAGYRLDLEPDAVDMVVFDQLAEEGRRLLDAGDPDAACTVLREADALWRGPALAEFADLDFARPTAVRLDQRRLTAIEDRFDAELASGRHAAIVDELADQAAAHPLRERLAMQLATALYRSGRQAEALRSVAAAAEHLREELGIEPSRPLRDVEAAILAHDPALDAPDGTQRRDDSRMIHIELAPEPSSFVGRSAELTDIVAALDESVHLGRFVVIEGEPGIGKTRLADEFAAIASDRGALTVWGRADEGGAAPGLWPWLAPLRIVSDLVPDVSELVTELLSGESRVVSSQADAARYERFEALRVMLADAARQRPIVILLDDLHWADDTTLDLLTFLAGRLDPGIVVVCTMRVLEIGRNDAITEALAAIARRQGSRRVQLRGLPLADTARMLATKGIVSTSVVASIHARAEGNPFFAIELSRLVSEEGVSASEIPGSVGDVIRRRLAHLPPTTVEVLGIAAVVGRQFDLGVLARAADASVGDVFERLEPSVVVRLVADDPEQPASLRFNHALIREVLMEDMTSLRRARLHLRVADAIEGGPTGVDDVEILAEHLWRASPIGVGARAAVALDRAADVALQRVSYASAEDLLTRAAQLHRATGVSLADYEVELATIRRLLEVARARRYFQGVNNPELLARARELADLLGRPDEVIDLPWFEWSALATSCRRVEAEAKALDFVRLTERDPRPQIRAMGYEVMGAQAWQAGRIGDAVRELAMALDLFAQTTVPLEGFYAESYLVAESFSIFSRAAHGAMTFDEAATAFDRLIDMLADPFATATLCGFACTAAMGHGAWHYVQHFATIAERVDPDLQFGFWSGQNLMHRALTLAHRGEVDDAIAMFADGAARYTGIGGRSGLPTFHAALAEALVAQGRLAEAAQYAAEARALLDADNELWNHTSVLVAEALVAAGRGRGDEAVTTLSIAVEVAEQQEAHAYARRARAVCAALAAV